MATSLWKNILFEVTQRSYLEGKTTTKDFIAQAKEYADNWKILKIIRQREATKSKQKNN